MLSKKPSKEGHLIYLENYVINKCLLKNIFFYSSSSFILECPL